MDKYKADKYKSVRELGRKFREKRLEQGLTQLQISTVLGYSGPQFISRLERNEVSLPIKFIPKVSKLLEANCFEVLEWVLDDHAKVCRIKLIEYMEKEPK